MKKSTTRGRSVFVAVAMVLAFTLAPTASAAKPLPEATCSLNPGDTIVSWRSYPKTTNIHVTWFDAAGAVITTAQIIPAGKPMVSFPTPAGAEEFRVDYFDATGQFGVLGAGCF